MDMKKHINNFQNINTVSELAFDPQEAKQIEWESEDEFRWKGEMYDVVAKTIQGDHLIIHCIPDNKETELVGQYLKASQRNSSENLPSSSLVKLITSDFLQPEYSIPELPEASIDKDFKDFTTVIISFDSNILTPPPKVA